MELLLILFLILINGIFSMSEIALVSSRKTRLELLAKKGSQSAEAALKIANAPNKFLSTVQIGITLIGILTGIFSGEKLTDDITYYLKKSEFLNPYAESLAVITVVVIITFLSLVLGELVPKRIGLSNPEAIARWVARPMNLLSSVTLPFVWLLTITSDLIVRVLGIKNNSDNKITEEEIKAIIQEGANEGEVQEIEQDIVERVFVLGDRKVASLMTSRQDLIYLELQMSKEQVLEVISQELHNMYPVYEMNPDKIIGVVYLKDLFIQINQEHFSIKKVLKNAQFLSENTSVYHALELFKKNGVHHGIISDEYGLTRGLITINDVFEALVGNVTDFHKDEFTLEEREDGSYLIDGQFPLHDFMLHFGFTEIDEDMMHLHTVSGLILQILERIPEEGEKVIWESYQMEVIDMDGARIDKILVKKNS